MDNLEPITRNEMFLNGDDLEPITREEMILAGADLEPITRHEWFLKRYRGGGGGGGYDLVNIPDLPADIASFDDGTDLPMASLKVAVTPYQDLHGYDGPWAGGAGKNKFDIDAEHTSTSGSATYTYELTVKPNTAYTMSSNVPQGNPASLYFNGGSTDTNGVWNGTPKTFTSDANGKLTAYVRYTDVQGGIDLYTAVKNGQYYIQLEEGSSATSYQPYSNICPIIGWDEANVVDDAVYGSNVNWNQLADLSSALTKTWNEDTSTYYGTLGTLDTVVNLYANHVYFYSMNVTRQISGNNLFSVYVIAANSGVSLSYGNGESNGFKSVITKCNSDQSAKNIGYSNYSGKRGFSNGDSVTVDKIQIIDLTQLFGETKANEIYAMEQAQSGSGVTYFKSLFYKDYYPYNSGELTNVSAVNGDTDKYRTYTIDLNGTRYGGTLDATDGTFLDMIDHIASYNGETLPSTWISDRDVYAEGTTPTIGAEVVYTRATPITVQLAPQPVKSIEGENNISANCGQITEVKYFKKA